MKIILSIIILLTSSCGNMSDRLKNIGKPPQFSDISYPEDDDENELKAAEYEKIKKFQEEKKSYYEALQKSILNPKEFAKIEVANQSNSLWKQGSRDFFRGKKARQIGDILKVKVSIANESAKFENKSSTTRATKTMASGAENVMGLDTKLIPKLKKLLGVDFDLTSLISGIVGQGGHDGSGSTDRKESVETQVAALVTKILPNGNLVIQAHQEVRVNHELREIMVSGIVRPDDIDANNTIQIDQIAEARVSYGGRGIISDTQKPKYGTELLDILAPF